MNKKFLSYKFVGTSFWFFYSSFVLIYVIYCILFGDILLCDSSDIVTNVGDGATDGVENNTEGRDYGYPVVNPGLALRIKRRISWYISGKKSGNYSSYSEFKDS
jgi:hypothetical protein